MSDLLCLLIPSGSTSRQCLMFGGDKLGRDSSI
jgi:hypothetical protein